MKREVALFGSGNVARKKYFFLEQLFEIKCCYDNDVNKIGELLYGIPIIEFSKTESGLYIVITTDLWEEIALQLEDVGLELGKDYLPYYIIDKLSYSSLFYLRRNFLNKIKNLNGHHYYQIRKLLLYMEIAKQAYIKIF